MATKESELKRLRREVEVLKKKVARLEKKNGKRKIVSRSKRPLSERERADEILRRAGLLSEPTEKEKEIAAEWMARPAEERERLLAEARAVYLPKPLSQIIIENRR